MKEQITAPAELALTLSGGGLRATLFHLGVLRRLAVAGDLHRVNAIFAVSGGSILAAHVRLNWARYQDPASFEGAAQEVIDLCKRDLRGRVVRRSLLCWLLLLPLFRWALSFLPGLRWLRDAGSAPADFLIREYNRFYRGAKLPAPAPGAPSLHLLSTSLNTGEICVFENDRFLVRREHGQRCPAQLTQVAVAVAASSAYPALFAPIRVDAKRLHVRLEQLPETHYLSDGGLFDNLGVMELLGYEDESQHRFAEVIVSDAGAAMNAELGPERWALFRRGIRTTDILMHRMSDGVLLRIARDPRFRRLSIHRSVPKIAMTENAQAFIGAVRTDLDYFTPRERALIANHGYQVAAELVPGIEVEPQVWPPAARAEIDSGPLAGSQTPNLWGLFNWKDWSSYAVLAAVLLWAACCLYGFSFQYLRRSHAAYKNRVYVEQCKTSAEVIESRTPKQVQALFTMREYWEAGRHADLGWLGFLPLHRITGAHNALMNLFDWPEPFPPLEHAELVRLRGNITTGVDVDPIVAYMQRLGAVWKAHLPQEFAQFRDESYLQIIRITDELTDCSNPGLPSRPVDRDGKMFCEGGHFNGTAQELVGRFYTYYWGRLLPVESQFKSTGDRSVETAMTQIGQSLQYWKKTKRADKGCHEGLIQWRDDLRKQITKELDLWKKAQ